MNKELTFHSPRISPEALAHLGDGEIAYIKAIRSEDVPAMFPQAPQIAPGLQLFALHAADGTPIMVTDSARSGGCKCLEPRASDAERPLTHDPENVPTFRTKIMRKTKATAWGSIYLNPSRSKMRCRSAAAAATETAGYLSPAELASTA